MYIVKVMKRRDAASVLVAIVLAMAVNQFLMMVSGDLTGRIVGESEGFYGGGSDWKDAYLYPAVWMLLQVVALEVLLRLVVWLRPLFVRKQK
jgi:hypothetical protein